jgi:peptidoglycan hydrolase-like protein with peptidoglycan-binding domain
MSTITRARHWLLALLAVLLLVGAPTSALAKKSKKGKNDKELPKVELVGLTSVDETFKQLRKLDNKVGSAEKEVDKSQRNLNKALGIKNDTPIKKALDDLKKKADGKVNVVTDGGTPKLQAKEGVPQNVSDAVDAVNVMTAAFSKSISDLKGAEKEANKLVKTSQKMPEKVKNEFKNDSGSFLDILFKLPKTMKSVGGNIKVAGSLPGRTGKVVGKMTGIIGAITSEFSPL